MPLVEVVRGRDTSEEAMVAVVALVRSIGKIPVRVKRRAGLHWQPPAPCPVA